MKLSPSAIAARTAVGITYTAPDRTGKVGSVKRYVVVSVKATSPGHGCLGSAKRTAATAAAGKRVKVSLDPQHLGKSWCVSRYSGRIDEYRQTVGKHSLQRHLIARFSFTVKAPVGTPPPPSFAGLTSAHACVPGAQHAGETAPFNLAWSAASDSKTPPSQIVYLIYLAHSPGGENYAAPTYTTAPGATSYTTPALALSNEYFVVRARASDGRTDANKVERAGVNSCV